MTLKEWIAEIRQKVSGLDYAADAYLNYANSVTGAEDTNVGDAIMSLAAGYGQGGVCINQFEYSSTFSGNKISIPVDVRGAKVIIVSMLANTISHSLATAAYSRWITYISPEFFPSWLVDSLSSTTQCEGESFTHTIGYDTFANNTRNVVYGHAGSNYYGGSPVFKLGERLAIEGINQGFAFGVQYRVNVTWIM